MNFIQGTLQMMEVGKGAIMIRLIPFIVVLGIIGFFSDYSVYKGLPDAQSMDNAQLARQLARGKGFTTEFLRPRAVSQLHDFAVNQGLANGKAGDLFPSEQFPPGTPRILPDTYNAPGYPYLLAGWFALVHPEFDQPAAAIGAAGMYAPDRCIPILNQVLLGLTAVFVFLLGLRFFDPRVAWMSLVTFLLTDLVWHYTLTALSTTLLMFLTTAAFWSLEQIVRVSEECFEREERSFAPAWIWALILALLLAAIYLTRLQLLVLVVPVVAVLMLMPTSSVFMAVFIGVASIAAVTPWFIHLNAISGSYVGSNGPVMLHGAEGYEGNQIYCTTAIPSYEQLFRDVTRKEYSGFRWNFQHAWTLLGTNPMVLMFGASILHQFKRRRTRMFHWLLFGSLVAILMVNNLGEDKPEDVSAWNSIVILLPCMIVVGSAFFFILLDRLSLQLWLLNNVVVILMIMLTALPLSLSLLSPGKYPFSWPPYWPYTIKMISQLSQPDEWVTSDMPWATAWYGDRASLWLPDSVTDFENFHDNVCPTGMMIFTPVTWEGPVSNITTGEYKEWFSLMSVSGMPMNSSIPVPQNFPLTEHFVMPGRVPAYTLWSDRPRWLMK
jgi:4-amino-4-deoxy-L-arabinose transferase-like glycosyltransferase